MPKIPMRKTKCIECGRECSVDRYGVMSQHARLDLAFRSDIRYEVRRCVGSQRVALEPLARRTTHVGCPTCTCPPQVRVACAWCTTTGVLLIDGVLRNHSHRAGYCDGSNKTLREHAQHMLDREIRGLGGVDRPALKPRKIIL